jgi:hypothetical protein
MSLRRGFQRYRTAARCGLFVVDKIGSYKGTKRRGNVSAVRLRGEFPTVSHTSPKPRQHTEPPGKGSSSAQSQPVAKSPLPPETKVSLSSMAIALCALVFSVYQACEQRNFQKLSARPRLIVSFNYNNAGAGITFGNFGIGYAMLKSFEVLVDGKPQPNWEEMCRALGFGPTAPTYDFLVPSTDSVIKPDSSEKIFWIHEGPQAEELKLKIARIQIRSCYCSIYDECRQLLRTDSGKSESVHHVRSRCDFPRPAHNGKSALT